MPQVSRHNSGPTFKNQGSLTQPSSVTDGSGMFAIFDQTSTGTTDIEGGGLYFFGGGTIASSMTSASTATIGFQGGTFNLAASSTLAGQGTLSLLAGQGTLSFAGATVNDAVRYSVTGNTNLSSGTLDFTNNQSVSIPNLTMSGGTLTGFSALTVTSATNWTNGTISGGGTITTDGTLTLGSTSDGNQPDLSGATLDNAGTATVANSYGSQGLYLQNGALFDNFASASFSFTTAARIGADGSNPKFQNDGSLIQPASVTGSSGIYTAFNQTATGLTDVQGGIFNSMGARR